MHKRKSSKDNDEQENLIVNTHAFPRKPSPIPIPFSASHSLDSALDADNIRVAAAVKEGAEMQSLPLRTRMNSVPTQQYDPPARKPPPSAGPYRTSFGSFAHVLPPASASPSRGSFGHQRTLSHSSVTGTHNYGPALAIPPPPRSPFGPLAPRSIALSGTSATFLAASNSSSSPPEQDMPFSLPSPQTTRRHQRIHSRNLSVYFPRPDTIDENGVASGNGDVQEIEYRRSWLNNAPSPITFVSQADEGARLEPKIHLQKPPQGSCRLGEGFTFGGRPARTISTISSTSTASNSDGGGSSSGTVLSNVNESANGASAVASHSKRRGHHHKHSMSHNFFSFLEPGANQVMQSQQQLSATSSTSDHSWRGSSPSSSSLYSRSPSETGTAVGLTSPDPSPLAARSRNQVFPVSTVALSIAQFILGGTLWVNGQQAGSFACTGLGYWVIFDAFGIALRHLLPAYLSLPSMQDKTRRSYGNARIETLLLFAQTLYLAFSSVYICKEVVEHVLLSGGNGHHHHYHVEDDGDLDSINLPMFLILTSVVSLISTCLFYDNHGRLLLTSRRNLPSFARFRSRSNLSFPRQAPSSLLAMIAENPFTTAPLLFSLALLGGILLLPSSQHQLFDLLLAFVEVGITFRIAYPVAVVQGAVLLQTAPVRGMTGGRMEAFLRVMREIERHPLILHLPAPHIWQLTPTPSQSSASASHIPISLVVTLELHVQKDIDDNELLVLTRWAHDRCFFALTGRTRSAKSDGNGHLHDDNSGDRGGTEVTVGVVKG